MKVIAIAPGFYGGARRRVDETFEVAKGEKGKWFIPAPSEPKAESKQTEKQKSSDPNTHPTNPAGSNKPASDLV